MTGVCQCLGQKPPLSSNDGVLLKGDLLVLDRPDIVHRAICEVLCALFPTVGVDAFLSAGRSSQAVAWARQVGMHVMAASLLAGIGRTARAFGRDRSTVLHAARLVEQHCRADQRTRAFANFVEAEVRARLCELAEIETHTGCLPPFSRGRAHG